jgi:cytochrome c-type biogenesis protein CcmH/NrfF
MTPRQRATHWAVWPALALVLAGVVLGAIAEQRRVERAAAAIEAEG